MCAAVIAAVASTATKGDANPVTNLNGDASAGSLGAELTSATNASSADSASFGALFNSTQTITLTAPYSAVTKNLGTGSLTISAPALLTLNDNGFTVFNFSGGGNFYLGNLSLKGTGTGLSLGANTSLSFNHVTIADGVTVAGNGINVASGTTSTIAGRVTGSGGLTETGPGTLVLSSTGNNYSGGTGVSGGGAVSVSSDANLGSTVSSGIGLNNGTLITTTGITTSRPVNVSSLGGAISVSSGQTSTFNGQIGGIGTLTANGTGTLVLGNTSNNYNGGTIIAGGTLSVANGLSLGTGNISIIGGTLQTTGTAAVNVFGSVVVGNGASVNVANAAQITTIETVTGVGGLNVSGSGTLNLAGSNSFTGDISVTGATLGADRDYELGNSNDNITLNGGTLATSDGLQTLRGLYLETNGGAVTVSGNGNTQLSGVLSGVGSLSVSGTGGVALAGLSNSYAGGTVVTGGATLAVAGDGSLGTGGVTLNNGTFAGPNSALTSARTFTIGSGGGTIVPGFAQAVTLTGKVTGTGGLTIGQFGGSGSVVLSGTSNDYSGGTTVTFGHTLLVQNGTSGSATGSGPLTVNGAGTIGGAGTVNASSFNLQGGSRVIVGTNTDVTSQMTLTGQAASTISGATLAFNLGAGVAQGESNLLNLGNTPVTFTSTTLALNVLGLGSIPADTPYTLIAFNSPVSASALGLTLGSNGQIISGLSIGSSNEFGASANGYSTSGIYAGSFLYLSGNDIDLEVLPEPETWLLLLSGLPILIGLGRLLTPRRC